MGSIFVAGIMALALVIYKRRVRETLRNIGRNAGVDVDVSYAGSRGFAGQSAVAEGSLWGGVGFDHFAFWRWQVMGRL